MVYTTDSNCTTMLAIAICSAAPIRDLADYPISQ